MSSSNYDGSILRQWLLLKFSMDNHSKYRKYFPEWYSNLTKDQKDGFDKQMNYKFSK